MKTLTKFFFITLVVSLTSISSVFAQNAISSDSIKSGNLIIKFTGGDSDNGLIMISLNNSNDGYNNNQPYKTGGAPVKNGKSEYVFENIPFGEYAVKCFHDENSNDEMDTNLLGIPKESYGFSNNARGSFGPASYEDAKFLFSKDSQVITIQIH